jgi:hypothetical protein
MTSISHVASWGSDPLALSRSFLVPPWSYAIFALPAYVLAFGVVLRLLGVSKKDVADWARKQADRHRFTDLIRAWRGLPDEKPDEKPALPDRAKRDDDRPAA